MSDLQEVRALQDRIAELEAQLAAEHEAAGQAGPGVGPAPPVHRHVRGLSVISGILVVLAVVLAPLSVSAVWANREISNTDQYVATVAPLVDSAAVRSAVADEVSTAVLDGINVDQVTSEALKALAAQPNVPPAVALAIPGLQTALVNGIDSFVRDQVAAVLASPQFKQVWEQVNRVAHQQVLRLLEGEQGSLVTAQGDTVTLNLGPVVAEVKQRLVAQGFSLAKNVPTTDRSFVLMQSSSITKAQWAYKALDTLGTWLPVIALACLAGGVALARDRRRALLSGSLGVVAAMLVLGILLALARSWYVGQTPGDVLTPTAAGDVFDTLVRFLRTGLRAVAVLFLLIAMAAFLSGPSSAAVSTRRGFTRGIGAMRGSAEAAGWQTGRVGTWTWTHRRALRWTLAGLGGLALAFWNQPNAWDVVLVAVLVLVGLAVVEFLGRPAGVRPAHERTGVGGPPGGPPGASPGASPGGPPSRPGGEHPPI